MPFCTRCGTQVPDNSSFCPRCGTPQNQVPPQNQPYAQPNYSQAPVQQSNASTPAIVLGIIGIVTAWLFALAGHVTSIISIVFGVKEYRNSGKVTGLVLGIVGETCSILSSLIGVIAVQSLF